MVQNDTFRSNNDRQTEATLQLENMDAQKYWKYVLGDKISYTSIPKDISKQNLETVRLNEVDIPLEIDLTRNIHVLAQKWGVKTKSILLAAYCMLISKYSGELDIIVGMPVQRENNSDFCVLPFRIEIDKKRALHRKT
ncbi:condensation domain-containing protein, partial [Brevibacillus agri]|uniref:condensation domain-containing protein n=1 Tax=Brevibacillus agri TaxID=51101 RepID=UPI003D1CD705